MPSQRKGRTARTTSIPAPVDVQDCLCLICRRVGHLAKLCPRFQEPTQDGDPSAKSQSPSVAFNRPLSPNHDASAQALCERCIQLEDRFDISAGPSKREQYMETVKRRTTPIPPLGPVTSIRLLSTCPLCRLMFDITYLSDDDLESIRNPKSPDEGQLALVPAWTLVHLDPAQEVWPKKEWGPHAVCIYTAVTRARSRWQPQIGVHAGVDAIAVVDKEESGAVGVPILGVEKVDSQAPDYGKIKEWFRRCDALHHVTCQPAVSEGLKEIKLVDVETRRIVRYPPGGCDYIALSYVWGGVIQPSYKLGDVLPTTPATLEDAMVVTRHLGKRYLWVDSLCIDQGDGVEKDTQIPLMSAIYTGAWATIFNLAGQSALSGLPRVGTLKGVIPQVSCEIGEKLLLSLMPPLRTQLSESLWNTRAWTFQEGLLSPRRLFFTNHQVYFECNLVQSCESIDDSRSAFHLLSDEAREASFRDALDSPSALVFSDPDEEFEGGVMRDPFRPIFISKEIGVSETFRIWKYEQLVHGYTSRKMTMDADALDAFSAILTRFEGTHYKKGFVHGLPVEDLPTALLWTHDDGVVPRRRDGFPSWSWVGWEGTATGATESCVRGTTGKMRSAEMGYLPPLRVWKAGGDGHPELVYDFNPVSMPDSENRGADEGDTNEGDEEGEGDVETAEGTLLESDGGRFPREDSDSWEDVSEASDDEYFGGENAKANPISAFARTMPMLEEIPSVPEIMGRDELLVQGVVFRLTFLKLGPERQDPEDCSEWCRIKVEDEWRDNCMILYGHNRFELSAERREKEEEFLLLRREKFDSALMWIDRKGDTAKRIGVASLVNLTGEDLWTVGKPEVRLIRLV